MTFAFCGDLRSTLCFFVTSFEKYIVIFCVRDHYCQYANWTQPEGQTVQKVCFIFHGATLNEEKILKLFFLRLKLSKIERSRCVDMPRYQVFHLTPSGHGNILISLRPKLDHFWVASKKNTAISHSRPPPCFIWEMRELYQDKTINYLQKMHNTMVKLVGACDYPNLNEDTGKLSLKLAWEIVDTVGWVCRTSDA